MISKNGSQYCVYSKEGKEMGCYGSRGEAEHRLAQIEYFKVQSGKRKDEDKKEIFTRMAVSMSTNLDEKQVDRSKDYAVYRAKQALPR